MLGNITLCVVSSLEMLISYIFFSKIGDRKYKTVICVAAGMLLFESAAALNILLSNTAWFNALYFAAINFVFAYFFFGIGFKKAVFYAVILDVFSTATEFAVIIPISLIAGEEITAYNEDPYLLIIEGSICKLLYLMICLLLLKFIKTDKTAGFPVSFHIYPLTALIILVAFCYLCIKEDISSQNRIILAILSTVLFGSVVFLFITYQHNAEKENELLLLKSKSARTETEQTYYDILERQNRRLAEYAHDAKNHLAIIKNLNSDPQIDVYIDKMNEDLKTYSSACRSGNKTLDVIINKISEECAIKGIDFDTDIRLNNLSFVEDYDLVAILGNLLNNAVDAAEKSKDKIILLETDNRNKYAVIIITNSCDEPPAASGEKLMTTKSDSSLHGIGLKTVKKTLQKYGGDYCWEYIPNERMFIMTVMLGSLMKNK